MAHRPRGTRALCWSGWVGLCLFSATVAAQAQGEAPSFAVEYDAPNECPSRDDFVRQISARTKRGRLGAAGPGTRTFTVQVDSRGGTMTIREPDGAHSTRDVPAENCRDAVAALAVIAALVLDPEADTSELPTGILPPVDAPSATPVPPNRQPARRTQGSPASSAPASPHEVRSSRAEAKWRVGMGVALLATDTVAPDPVLSAMPFVDLALDTINLLAPSVRLGVTRAKSGVLSTSKGDAQLTWTAVRATACPIRWPSEGAAWLRPCGSMDLGRLSGTGRHTVDPATEFGLWWALGTTMRAGLDLFDTLRVELEGGAIFPLTRDRFYFDPDITAHEVPAAGFTGAIGVGVVLP